MSSRLFFSIFLNEKGSFVVTTDSLTSKSLTSKSLTSKSFTSKSLRYRRHCPPLSSSEDLNSLK